MQTGLSDFEYQRDYFSTARQIILPDLRGHGNSISEDFQNYFTDSAKDLKETLEELDISSAHIVGCSLGALVAVSFETQAPDMVKSLTVSGILAERPNQWIQLHEEDDKHQRQLLGDEG